MEQYNEPDGRDPRDEGLYDGLCPDYGRSIEDNKRTYNAYVAKHPTPGGPDTAMREQAGKLPYHLIPGEYHMLLAAVLEYGATKYAPRNFEQGLPYDDLLRGAEAHLIKLKLGEVRDAESGLPHAAHAAWNLLTFAMQMMRSPMQEKQYEGRVQGTRGALAPNEAKMVVDLRGVK